MIKDSNAKKYEFKEETEFDQRNIVINEKFNEFGLKLKANNEIKSQRLQKLYKEYNKRT